MLTAQASGAFTICGSKDNDLVRALPLNEVTRVDTPADAIARAADGSAVLILAEGYPAKKTALPDHFYSEAAAKHLHLYVEFPARVPGMKLPAPRPTNWERGVIQLSEFFDGKLAKLRIVQPHDCQFIPLSPDENAPLVMVRIAGFDSAVYGIPKNASPLLFAIDHGRCLIATTKLSGFVTARFSPQADWPIIWRGILHQLDPTHEPPALKVDPIVRSSLAKNDSPPADFERATFDRAARFYTHARLLITPTRDAQIRQLLQAGVENCPPPPADEEGDGSRGILEGYSSGIRFDGSQLQRTPVRSDCNAEAAMVLALDAKLNRGRMRSGMIASNLLDFVYGPRMETLGRSDPQHPAFGLIAWGAYSPAWKIANYGDDDARVILSTLLASSAMKSDRWDEPVLRAMLANARTTGKLGFRGDRIDIPQLQSQGWKAFHDASPVNYSPHFESYLWACNLWAYARTGDSEFLDRTTNAIAMTMDAYAKKQWRWMDNIERSRMLLCLSWLVRVQDTPMHRQWLMTVAEDLLQSQQPCGAIAEVIGDTASERDRVPQSNQAYGTTETPLIQKNGDPASDQLYTTGFALLGLHEAVAATKDEKLKSAENKLADYLCRIQIRSEKLPYLDGAWFRAFDYGLWDTWASSADVGWGAWSVEAGWGQAWIAATLAMRDQKTSFWDMTASSNLKAQLAKVQSEMSQNTGGSWAAPSR